MSTESAARIGRDYTRGLAWEGAQVVVADIDPNGAADTVRLIAADEDEAVALPVDVSS